MSLAATLAKHRPSRVFAPGEVSLYSNYGAALAGAIVAHVSGLPFEDYVERNILTPLGMQSTSFREPYPLSLAEHNGLPSPLPPALAEDLADGFSWRAGAFQRDAFEHVVQFAPAGAASGSGADVARYMVALMSSGGGVLKPDTTAGFANVEPMAANAPGVSGFALGMQQSRTEQGWRGWGHFGDTLDFHSAMVIYPALDLGVFVATNAAGGVSLRNVLPEMIANRLGGRNVAFSAPSPPDSDLAPELAAFEGLYLSDRRAFSTAQRALCLFVCIVDIRAAPEGRLVATYAGKTRRLAFMDEFDVGAGRRLTRFRILGAGEIAAITTRNGKPLSFTAPFLHATRLGPLASPTLLLASVALGFFAALAATASGLSRVAGPMQRAGLARASGVLVPLAGVAWAGAIATGAYYFAEISVNLRVLFDDWPGLLGVAPYGAAAAAGLSALALFATLLAWPKASWSAWRRARILGTLACFAGLAVALHVWNLLVPRF